MRITSIFTVFPHTPLTQNATDCNFLKPLLYIAIPITYTISYGNNDIPDINFHSIIGTVNFLNYSTLNKLYVYSTAKHRKHFLAVRVLSCKKTSILKTLNKGLTRYHWISDF